MPARLVSQVSRSSTTPMTAVRGLGGDWAETEWPGINIKGLAPVALVRMIGRQDVRLSRNYWAAGASVAVTAVLPALQAPTHLRLDLLIPADFFRRNKIVLMATLRACCAAYCDARLAIHDDPACKLLLEAVTAR